MIMTKPLFKTYDLGLATALVTAGFDLKKLDNFNNPKKFRFSFINDDRLQETIDQYWRDQLKANPRALFDNQKMIKNRIYSVV
jgi:hypothetical protein